MKRLIHKADKRVEQTLSSGIHVRQDFRRSARLVLFDTGLDEWTYATHGGTLFVVALRGKPYGLTCGHVLKDFGWRQLVVTDRRDGKQVAGLKSIYYPSQPEEHAVGSDVLDVTVVEFSDDVDPSFFKDAPYIIDPRTVATSKKGDTLHCYGAFKNESEITEQTIIPAFGLLEMMDNTPTSNDVVLRRAFGQYDNPQFVGVTGLSGSPVFNVTSRALCGMVVRGTMMGDRCTLWYIDMHDVMVVLMAAHENKRKIKYHKKITRLIDVESY